GRGDEGELRRLPEERRAIPPLQRDPVAARLRRLDSLRPGLAGARPGARRLPIHELSRHFFRLARGRSRATPGPRAESATTRRARTRSRARTILIVLAAIRDRRSRTGCAWD